MAKMLVFHREKLASAFLKPKQLAKGWPQKYSFVAEIEAATAEEAFWLSNTGDRLWWLHDRVYSVSNTPLRSTSVGDLIVTEDAPMLCCSEGWEKISGSFEKTLSWSK